MKTEEFYKELEKNNIILNGTQKEQFKVYCDYLLEYNTHTNLTAIRDKEGVYLKHFLDSASIAYKYKFIDEKIMDIGTGAGFPGIVLKILFPEINLTLVDSNNKKTKFLEQIVEKLKLKNVIIINDRIENLNIKSTFDIVTSRAVSELRILSELSLPFLKINGKVIALKSHIEEELKVASDTIELLGGSTPDIIDLDIPLLGKRCFVTIEKIKETPEGYPRIYDKILKYPLKKNNK